MTTYSTDFSEYTLSVQPSDWTERWDTGNVSSTAVADGDIRGKILSIVGTNAGNLGFLAWNDINADANRKNIEILARIRGSVDQADGAYVWARASGTTAGTRYGIGARLSFTGDQLGARHVRDGTALSGPGSGGVAFVCAPNTWYWIRARFNTVTGTHTYSLKAWAGALSDEPGTPSTGWMVTPTSTWAELDQVGWAGVMAVGACTVDCDYFAVGTNGDTAPGPSIGLTSHTVTDITSTTATIGITSDSTDGTLYWFVSTSATPPSEANLKAGTGSVAFGSDATPTAGANTAAVTGLSASTTYYRHWFQESTVYKSSIATSTGFTTSAGVGEDPALRLDALGGSNELLDTDTGTPRAVASAEYVVLGGTAGSRTITKQGTVAITSGAMGDITDAALETLDATFKVVLIAGDDDQGVYDATVIDRNA